MINLGLCIPSRVSKAKINMIQNAIQLVLIFKSYVINVTIQFYKK